MKVLAINGSPRKNGNTATFLKNALEGAASQGADGELVHLYDNKFMGCVSCLACKLKNRNDLGCAMRDELTPIIEKTLHVDALILGSPIYFSSLTSGMRAFFERAAYPYLPVSGAKFPKQIKVGLILNMGADEQFIKEMETNGGMVMNRLFEPTEIMAGLIFGSAESLVITNTKLYPDEHSEKYTFVNEVDADTKKRSEELFQLGCKKAFDLGTRLLNN